MERSKSIISIAVGIASILIIWRVGFHPSVPQPTETTDQTRLSTESGRPGQTESQVDSNEPQIASEPNAPEREDTLAQSRRTTEPNEPGDPNDPLVAVNLNNTDMKKIIQTLTEWTGKVIIPTDDAMKTKVTIYAPKRVPRSKALSLIYSALRIKGFVAKHTEDVIYIEPLTDSRLGEVPIIAADYPLAMIENKDQVVQKFFNLKNYSPSQMGQILLPLMGEYGYISADEETGSLLIIDTVKNLMGIALIIEQFDVIASEKMMEEIFEIRHSSPSEIIEILQSLLADSRITGNTSSINIRGGSSNRNTRGSTQQGRPNPPQESPGRPDRNSSSNRRSGSGSSGGGTATTVMVGTARTQPVLIAEPRNNWIIAKATAEDMEIIRQWISKLDVPLRTILASDAPLESFENKNQTVQKFFKLKNYSPSQMAQIIEPLLGESGYISAEESTRTLLVIDTVENLIRIRGIINTFDVPEAEQTVPQIFEIRYGDPSEIVQLIRILLSEDASATGSSRNTGRNTSASRTSSRNTSNIRTGNTSSGGNLRVTTSSSVIGVSDTPVVLIPLPQRKWIIARAPAETMKQIEEWIIKLDQKEAIEKEYEAITVKYVDVSEVAQRINNMLTQMPGQEITKSILVQPLAQARQIMVFGREDLREMVKKLIIEVDIPTGQFETEHFRLKYADPDQIKTNLDELYGEASSSGSNYRSYYYIYRGVGSSTMSSDTVKVISYIALRQVTVIASAENMVKIRKQIAEWDVPIDVESLKPRIIELRNVDPAQMASLLTTLFSEEAQRSMSYYDFYYGSQDDKQKIIGPLYGQLTFEDVPGTKKIIVISKIAEAYDVVEALVRELDKEEMAEVPTVVTLKFADPERLCEILNAMFCEAGSTVEILRSATGLSQYSMDDSSSEESDTSQDGYTPWWSSAGARRTTDTERPISNVIGKIRFVPESRTKSILVLSPPEFLPNIENLIATLDVPGKQVMIKAVIMEVDHKDLSSLGVQLASNTSAFGALEENSILALNAFEQLDRHGAVVFGAGGNQGTQVENTITANVYGLLDFLQKKVNAKILNQQTLWTEDNEEASFFKGDRVAFYTAATTGTGTSTQNFEFQRVGMNLAVRPSITPTKDVDMIINIIISQLSTEEENGQPVRTEMETQTNMIIGDGETLMLGGILFQQDSVIKRGIPGLSDIPLLGALFSHEEKTIANNELLVFITPYVINDAGENTPETQEQIDIPKEKLEQIRKELNTSMEGFKENKDVK